MGGERRHAGKKCSSRVNPCKSHGVFCLPGNPGCAGKTSAGRVTKPEALFLPSGTLTSQATCADIKGNLNFLFFFFPCPVSLQILPFAQIVMLFFPHALHIPATLLNGK